MFTNSNSFQPLWQFCSPFHYLQSLFIVHYLFIVDSSLTYSTRRMSRNGLICAPWRPLLQNVIELWSFLCFNWLLDGMITFDSNLRMLTFSGLHNQTINLFTIKSHNKSLYKNFMKRNKFDEYFHEMVCKWFQSDSTLRLKKKFSAFEENFRIS